MDELAGATQLSVADREGNIVSLTLHPSGDPSPALVVGSSGPILALGSAARRRTTSSLVQVISSVIDRGSSLEDLQRAAVDGRGKLR